MRDIVEQLTAYAEIEITYGSQYAYFGGEEAIEAAATITELRAEVERLREGLETIEHRATNHGGWFDQPGQQFAEYAKLGEIARAYLERSRP